MKHLEQPLIILFILGGIALIVWASKLPELQCYRQNGSWHQIDKERTSSDNVCTINGGGEKK